MNKLRRPFISFGTSNRSLATTADLFAGLVRKKHKLPSYMLTTPPRASCGGRYIVTMLPGVGSGPQMMEYVRRVFEAACAPVDFEIINDMKAIKEILTSIRRNGVAIKGHIPELPDLATNVTLRSQLDMYVYKVHILSVPNIKSRMHNIDVYVFRQNIEGEYAMLEHTPKPGIVESLKIITRDTTIRFAHWAYGFARRHKRKHVTIVHKANIMKLTDGLFLKTIQDIGKDYPEIKTTHNIVDSFAMQIVKDPTNFDVILTPNLYGNIVISIFCGLIGGHGIISGENFGDECAIYEVGLRHLAFEDEMYVNPIAMINAGVKLLYYLKKDPQADLIAKAVRKTLVEDKIHTPDLGGQACSCEVVSAIIGHIQETIQHCPKVERK